MNGTEDIVRDAYALGRRNQEIVELARAWCKHIRRDRAHMGIGIIEQQTGLPVSGGTFACDFARGPSPEGASLEVIALDFYERNCATCKHRLPTGIVQNLGTWAQRIADQKREEAAQQAREFAARETVRADRHRHRRLRAGRLDAVAQSIVELLERLDAEAPDHDAANELTALARLHPDAFTPELLAVLASDAEQFRSEACLDALVIVREHSQSSLSALLPVALKALRQGWGAETSASIAALHAAHEDLDEDLFRVAVRRSSCPLRHWPGSASASRPGLLLRLFSVAPERSMTLLVSELAHQNDWRRAAAAQAAKCLLDADLCPTEKLVDCLLEALQRADDSRARHAEARTAVEDALSSIMKRDAALVESRIEQRWSTANTQGRIYLLNCYDHFVRKQLRVELHPDVPTAAARRALSCILERQADLSLVTEAAELIELIFDYHGKSANIEVDTILGSLALVCRTYDAMNQPDSSIITRGRQHSQISALEREQRTNALGVAMRSLVSAASALAPRQCAAFWSGFGAVWNGDPSESPILKAQLVSVLGRVAIEPSAFAQALPYLYSALLGSEHIVRASAVDAFKQLLEEDAMNTPLPEAVTLGLIGALSDQYLIVIARACDTIGFLPIPPSSLVTVLNKLLGIAEAYALDHKWDKMVKDALQSARVLTRRTKHATAVDGAVLSIIDIMSTHDAIEILSRMHSLSSHPKWTASVIKAMRADFDPEYDELHEDDTLSFLQTLAYQSPEQLTPHVAELIQIALRSVPEKPYRAWRVADLLSSLSFEDAAEEIANKALAAIPDTRANNGYRLQTAALNACFRAEAAAARGDATALAKALHEWNRAQVAAEQDAEENKDARGPFRASFIPV